LIPCKIYHHPEDSTTLPAAREVNTQYLKPSVVREAFINFSQYKSGIELVHCRSVWISTSSIKIRLQVEYGILRQNENCCKKSNATKRCIALLAAEN
jgi:hypothetical protein